ncbi:PaaI family thioesterase [Chelatococcus reniformis]|uniref:PaaI family thioesterase n=1 Tax=Chelatococcus reniformis TaxID=1494448 RepID=A0A916UYG2_9HYPH|nr:PaaI family thioesterase [Chelatococcus reniformis]GGC93957.1 hypothetical protein GCM10010994_59680 [Chelatococcus reniformis]
MPISACPPQTLQQTELDELAIPSPFRDMLGVHVAEWEQGRCAVELDVRPDLVNFSGAIAGPVVAAMVDIAGGLAGCYSPDRDNRITAVTLSVTIAFMGTVKSGRVRAVAVKQGGGRRVYTATVHVYGEDGHMISTGQGTYRYVS